jgi:sirohydrochlorin ferrochelatase
LANSVKRPENTPSRLALLVSHGQPSVPAPAEIHLAYIAAQVGDHLPGWEVRSATLSAKGALEAEMIDGAVIFPFFMARGYFTARILPARLKGRRYRMATPFGLLPGLPAMTAALLRDELAARGWGVPNAQILLAAHGSARGPKAAEAAENFASQLRHALPGPKISTGYVEQDPSIAAAARPLGPQSLCLPFFAQSGEHVREDIPKALNNGSFLGDLLPSLGAAPRGPVLIAEAVEAAAHSTVLGASS